MTDKTCYYYNHGGSTAKNYSSYPTEYGARCEKHNAFFAQKDGKIIPSCEKCKFKKEQR